MHGHPYGYPRDPNTTNPREIKTPIHCAASDHDWNKVFDLIDRHGGNPNARCGYYGRSLMQRAAYEGNIYAMEGLLKRGAMIQGQYDTSGNDVIHSAVQGKQLEALQWLHLHGANLVHPNGQETSRRTALHLAATGAWEPGISQLLEWGVNPNIRDARDNTPLLDLSYGGQKALRIANLLLDYGADIHALNQGKESVLSKSTTSSSYFPMAKLALDLGVSTEEPSMVRTAIERARTATYNKPMMQLLQDRDHYPPLRIFSGLRKEDLFKTNEHGLTPLDNPETWRHMDDIIYILEKRGMPLKQSDLLKKNRDGKTFMQRGIECRKIGTILEILENAGEHLDSRAFAEPNGQVSALGQAVRDFRVIGNHFARLDQWRSAGSTQLSRFYQGLPKGLQSEVPNFHGLMAALRREEVHAEGRGSGRA